MSSLNESLVGATWDYSFKKKIGTEEIPTIDKLIVNSRALIEKECSKVHTVDAISQILFLGALTDYYRHEKYYMAVRGSISMGRQRPKVLDYLNMDAEEQQDRLLKALGKTTDKNRDLIISAVGYFTKLYPNRLKSFLPLLTKEEKIYL